MDGIVDTGMVRDRTNSADVHGARPLGNATYNLPDHLFHTFGVKVAHNDYCLAFRLIPAVVEGKQFATGGIADDCHVADGNSVGIAATREQYG